MQKAVKYLDYVIYWAIVVIPFSISLGPAFTNILMGFMFFSFLVKKIIKREKWFIRTTINIPFILLVVISLLSFKNTIDYHASVKGLVKLIQNALIFLVCVEEIKDRRHIGCIVLSVILGASLSSIDAVWQILTGRDFIRGYAPIINIGLKRATAAFPNANVFGVYLSAITPLIIGLALYYFKGRAKVAALAAAGLASLGVMLTFSRPTILALFLSILFLVIVKKDKVVAGLLLLVLVISPFVAPKGLKDWARLINYNPIIFMCNHDRISIYRNSLNMIRHHPVLGVGVNTFSKNYLKYKLPEPENAQTADNMYAHNTFLQMAGEIGLLGLLAFLWLLFNLFKRGARIYRSLSDRYYKIISLSLSVCLFAFLVNGLTETSLYYARVAMIFWYLAGFSLALEKFIDADNTSES